LNRTIALIAAILVSTPALAQWGQAPAAKPTPAPAPATPAPTAAPAPAPAAAEPAKPAASPRRQAAYEDEGASGFAFGLRGAWAIPFGDLNNTDSIGDDLSGQLPIWIEAGWRFNKNVYAGLYFQYAFAFSHNCPPSTDCSASGEKVGLEAIYNLAPDAGMQPWAGLGLGYEWASVSRAGDDRSYKGLELLNLQVGIDLAPSKSFSVGPFASFSFLGKYSSMTASGQSNDISASHEWLQLGLKVAVKM
jgi:hypothetical protein